MRVHGRNPLASDAQRDLPDPDPESWRLLTVQLEHKPGEYVDAQLLRPLAWIAGCITKVGERIWLELPEMQASGKADVVSIDPCPAIDAGTGPIVTGTFKHLADSVVSVCVEGSDNPIGCTSEHPFWSETRQAFVPACQLEAGEAVLTASGNTARITSIIPRAGPAMVYGLEV